MDVTLLCTIQDEIVAYILYAACEEYKPNIRKCIALLFIITAVV